MKLRLVLVVCAAALVLAACGSPVSSSPPALSPSVTPSPVPAVSNTSYADTTACGAFTEATTGGAPAGQDPLAWLQSQAAGASPLLAAAVSEYVLAREVDPGKHPGEIRRLAGKIARMCAAGG